MKKIVVVDGLGGGIGVELVSRLKDLLKSDKPGVSDATLIALGSNAIAVERMVKAGASRGATGENAIRIQVQDADIILGPIGIIIANSMMGEITSAMVESILASSALRILLPLQNDHFTLAGFEGIPLAKMIERAVELTAEKLISHS
jgi:hypothetical protein